jgi:hypothetical protein
VQAAHDLVKRECSHACRGQFDRQRHAIEAPADLGHRGRVVVGDGELRSGAASPVTEQLDRLVRE